ncbi:heavy metal translocating P-type ATPase [Veillonella sp. YH-vei2232]|uniref:Cd(2+)-exporting ATPase n=1 Tax=Veillonella absiana TaxID=3079305 RepID=A0ABU3Z8S0_9FIRM|nr:MULTISPECIES: heavy metal translocating P-type ATPase [unclassified Veillonella]MDV5062688.1 heavy metal translocating P-type ATPase [Veillonella sp. YH-vei2232]MDV5088097.1 heavy metal translocating P-type ATPase [Veillonella sp. YH-vei2233]
MEQTYVLKNLCCANCAAKISDRVSKLEGIETADFTLATQQFKVTGVINDVSMLGQQIQDICDVVEEGVVVEVYKRTPKKRLAAVTECGCCGGHDHAHGDDHGHDHGLEHAGGDKSGLVIVAGLAFMAFELLTTFVPSLSLPEPVELALFGIAYIFLAFPVLRTAGKNILKGEIFDENFLMSIATLGAIAIGSITEAVGVMLFYRIGVYFEERATERSRTEILNAIDMRPQEVRVVGTDGAVTIANPEDVAVGQIIEVRAGDSIPLDGTVVEGTTRINTAPVTGEPVPVKAEPGTELLSGCINENSRITMRVDKPLDESMVTKILDAVENAASSKPKIDRFITRFAKVYTPIVVFLALAVAIIPSLITGEWEKWIYTALTFLVISCPCALVLSVPLAFFSGIGNASKQGILLKGGRVIEALANITAVAMDKTGTITTGEFKVVDVATSSTAVTTVDVLRLAGAVEISSSHPIANSIMAETDAQYIPVTRAESIQEFAGEGLVGTLVGESLGNQVLVGNRRLMDRYEVRNYPNDVNEYGTEVLVAVDGYYVGRIVIADTPRHDSAKAIHRLNDMGIQTVMLTGDGEASAQFIAKSTGVSAVKAQLLPQDKLSAVTDIRKEYGPTMFVGDGINDAPVLAGADVGSAMGSGADAAIEAADVVFMRPSLESVAKVLNLSKATVSIAWQNVIFAIAVKILIMGLGLAGYASMWWAVFGDTGVSILCILNSVRIFYKK